MRTYRKWVLTLGIMTVTPGVVMGGPFSFLKTKSAKTTANASKATKSNQQVANDVARALDAAKLKGKGIKIDFKNGIVLLRGQVTDVSQKVKASRVAGRVPGVSRTDNRLTIMDAASSQADSQAPQALKQQNKSAIQQVAYEEARLPLPAPPSSPALAPQDNQRMAVKVAKALSSSPLRDNDISVRFQNGQAALSGSVADAKQREAAGRLVSKIAGVKSVSNQLKVGQAGAPQMAQGLQQPQFAGYPTPAISPATFQQRMMAAQMAPAGMPAQGMPATPAAYSMPHLPEYAWPSTAAHPNYAQVSYPKQYSASAWPYIGPYYPYPQVPLGWRQAQLEWDDGAWNLNFRARTDRWWWFLHPKNW